MIIGTSREPYEWRDRHIGIGGTSYIAMLEGISEHLRRCKVKTGI